jgi:hypothetical protein
MPTVCRLLRHDLAVSGRINVQKAVEMNKLGGWTTPANDTTWLHAGYAGTQVTLDEAMLREKGGFVPDQVVSILRLVNVIYHSPNHPIFHQVASHVDPLRKWRHMTR